MVKKHSETYKDIDAATSSFYMSTVSIPFLCVIGFFFEDPAAFDLTGRSYQFYTLYSLSLASGIMLTFSQNLCTVVNSPIITSITGNVKDVLLTFVSLVIFNDISPNFWLVLGLCLSLVGAFVYSIPKITEDKKKTN